MLVRFLIVNHIEYQKLVMLTLCCLIFLSACTNKATVPVTSREVTVSDSQTTVSSRGKTAPVEQVVTEAVKVPAPINESRPGRYIVKKGDTLYSIAWRSGQDYKQIASWNGIEQPYTIYPGQEILTIPPVVPKSSLSQPKRNLQPGPIVADQGTETSTAKQTDLQPQPITDKTTPKENNKQAVKSKPKQQPSKPKQQQPITIPNSALKWRWPTAGKLVKLNQPTSKKGIDISGSVGQTVKTSAQGSVVYSGSGLLGYGKLIIIKHNDTYLSAYAHNSELLVTEGDRVDVGQTIAKMGKTPSGQALLHFEIRKNGKPVNPLKLLPKR